MAWKMNFTDKYGDNYPNSYWKVVQYNSSLSDGSARLVLYAYADEAHKGLRDVGQKPYDLNVSDLLALIGQPVPNPLPEGVTTIRDLLIYRFYVWTLAKLDTDDGNGGLKSFFDGAEKV